MMKRTFWLPLCSAGLAFAACGLDDAGSGSDATAGAGGTTSDTTTGASASHTGMGGAARTGTSSTDPLSEFCSGEGPIVAVSDGSTSTSFETCTGRIAETRFMNALCTCNDATVAGYLKTRSFDSSRAGPSDTGGSVGINHIYANTTGYTDVGGSLTIAGQNNLNFAGYLQVGGNFKAASNVVVAGYTKIWSDAWLGGNFTDLGPVTIKGDLHRAGTLMAIPLTVDGVTVQEAVSIENPCPCEPKDLLDIGFIVDSGKTANDNAAYGIRQAMLNAVVGDVEVTLPCGRFYFERVGGIGNIIVNVTGRVAVFVDGPFEAAGNVEFRIADAAEVDIFVKGDLVLTGRAVFGNKDRPAASRIYVGGSGDVLLIGADGFVGNVYAPRSKVTAIGYAQVYGSVFAKDFVIPGYANFVYDRAIQHAGDTCGDPGTPGTPPAPPTCDKCGTCSAGTACVDGKCGACTGDADCCSPFVCLGGVCSEELVLL
jgi:hypothetical protein